MMIALDVKYAGAQRKGNRHAVCIMEGVEDGMSYIPTLSLDPTEVRGSVPDGILIPGQP
jgi:hypothetical protein